jgi:hypothetical protein
MVVRRTKGTDMKKLIVLSLFLTACGYTSKGNELVGQVKKVIDKTPVICSDYVEVDLSLGVMRNGVGSMSHEDVDLYVPNASDATLLKRAAESGQLVKISYDEKRWPAGLCVPTKWVTSATLVVDPSLKVEAPAVTK